MSIKKERLRTAFLQSLFIILGNTFGIWGTFIATEFLFAGIVPDLTWPGIMIFVSNGSLLIITFSILTTTILTTTPKKEVNLYNGSALIILIFTIFFFVRQVALESYVSVSGSTIPFTLSSILLFFALKDQRSLFRKYSWLSNTKNEAFYYNIFLSFAIAGNKSSQKRDEMEKLVKKIHSTFKECGYSDNEIFNASEYFDNEHNKQIPSEAAREDFRAVENSKNFILFYPEEAATSALIELGYALRDRRNILLISKDEHVLPFLARGIPEVHDNVRTLFYDDLDDLCKKLKVNHTQLLNR